MCAVRALNSYSTTASQQFAKGVEMRLRNAAYLAEIHTLHTLTAQGGTDRRAGTGLAGSHDQFNDLIHLNSFSGHCRLIVVFGVSLMM